MLPSGVITHMELSGRDRELARVLQALADVRGGGRRALAVVGEAGIGKSALLAAIAEWAAPLRVFHARAAEHEREVPFALAVDAFDVPVAALAPRRLEALSGSLRGVLPAVGDLVPAPAGPAERVRVHRALADLLDQFARERPVVLLVDDVHWADEASLELLGHLVRRPPVAPHLLVLAARPGTRLPEVEQLVLEPLDFDSGDAAREPGRSCPPRRALCAAGRQGGRGGAARSCRPRLGSRVRRALVRRGAAGARR